MEVIAPVTDYIKGSILTTLGDIIKHDGVSAKRMPVIAPACILRTTLDQIPDLEYRSIGQVVLNPSGGVVTTEVKTILLAYQSILTLNIGTVYIDDEYIIQAIFIGEKITNGDIVFRFCKDSGTGSMAFHLGSSEFKATITMIDGQFDRYVITQKGIITTAGTIILKLEGLCSAGSFVIPVAGATLSQITLDTTST